MSTLSNQRLDQALGTRDVVFFFISAVLSLRWIAAAAAAGPSSLVIWLIALVAFFLPLAFTSIELSSRLPGEGGIYLWSKTAFGDFAGFVTGWTYWTSNIVYFPALLYFSAGTALYVWPEKLQRFANSGTYFIVVSLAALALATVMNVVGLHVGKRLHTLGAMATWIPAGVLIFGGAAVWMLHGSARVVTRSALIPATGLRDIVFWSTIAFAFGGLEAASLMGGEIRDARRAVPRAIVISGILITLVYLLGTAAILLALPAGQVTSLQGLPQAIEAIASRLGLTGLDRFTALVIAVSGLGGIGAWLASTARLPFVAGIDRLLPPAFGSVHPRYRTPWISLIIQAVLSAAITIMGQAGASVKNAYDILVSLGIIAYFIPFLFMFAAMIRLQREPAASDVIRVPGGRPVATFLGILGIATTAVSIFLACIPAADDPRPMLSIAKVVGLSILNVAIGVGVYLRYRMRSTS